ncbi:MAG: S9 family peptidase, partial [Planctomycetes bacterium]|nr:S9 family peptidase [Planctomycetota bacterium]
AEGKRPPVGLTSGDHDHSAPRWHPDGRWVYTTANWTETPGPEEVQDLLRVPSGGGKAEFLTPPKNLVSSHAVSPDGRLLAYAIVPGTKYYKHPVPARVRDLATGRDRAVSAALDTEAGSILWGKDGREILFLAPLRGDVHVYAAPADGRSAPRPVVEGKRQVLAFDVSPRTGTVAFVATAPDSPADLWVRLPDGRERRVTSLCAGLVASRATSAPEEIVFRGHGGLQIQGWWMPARGFRKGKPGRLAVELHGGPHIMWGNTFWHEFQVLASAGYSVFFCNPRGSLGYGLKFKGMLYRHWGVDDSKDVLAGTDLLVKRKVADPKKLYLLGGSYGGYLTGWIVGHDHRFRAAVAQRGVYNLTTIYAGSDAQCLADWEFDASPWDPAILLEHSPISYAHKVRTPTLVKHSDCDFTATINTAEEYYNALKRNGVDTAFVRYPREGHELSRSGEPAHRVDRIKRILDWFAKHP